MHTIGNKKLLMLKPSQLMPTLCRNRKELDGRELHLLAKSISLNGIIEPLAVRKTEDGKYELISGERRLKAAVLAGLRRVPCVIHTADRKSAVLYSLIENMQRKNLTCFEEARTFEKLMNEYSMLKSEIALRLGVTTEYIENKLMLLRYDNESIERINLFGLSEEHAIEILRLPLKYRHEALDTVISEDMTVAVTREYVNRLLTPQDEVPKAEAYPEKPQMSIPYRKYVIGDMRLFYNSLSKLTSTLTNSGIDASLKKSEGEKFIEYRIRINKSNQTVASAEQLKIC